MVTAAELQDEFGASPNILIASLRELDEKEVHPLDMCYMRLLMTSFNRQNGMIT